MSLKAKRRLSVIFLLLGILGILIGFLIKNYIVGAIFLFLSWALWPGLEDYEEDYSIRNNLVVMTDEHRDKMQEEILNKKKKT